MLVVKVEKFLVILPQFIFRVKRYRFFKAIRTYFSASSLRKHFWDTGEADIHWPIIVCFATAVAYKLFEINISYHTILSSKFLWHYTLTNLFSHIILWCWLIVIAKLVYFYCLQKRLVTTDVYVQQVVVVCEYLGVDFFSKVFITATHKAEIVASVIAIKMCSVMLDSCTTQITLLAGCYLDSTKNLFFNREKLFNFIACLGNYFL